MTRRPGRALSVVFVLGGALAPLGCASPRPAGPTVAVAPLDGAAPPTAVFTGASAPRPPPPLPAPCPPAPCPPAPCHAAPCHAACRPTSVGYVGFGPSYGPDLGGGVEIGVIVARTSMATFAAEVRGTYLYVDNTEVLDLGGDFVEVGWRQVDVGVKAALAPSSVRHLTLRAGLTFADVRGNLNVVRENGRYYGGYVGFGFETDLSDRFAMGPDVTLSILRNEDGGRIEYVPRLGWHLTWKF